MRSGFAKPHIMVFNSGWTWQPTLWPPAGRQKRLNHPHHREQNHGLAPSKDLVTSSGDFRVYGDAVCCSSLTGRNAGFPCVSQAWAAALLWVTEKILTLFSVRRAGPKTRPFWFLRSLSS